MDEDKINKDKINEDKKREPPTTSSLVNSVSRDVTSGSPGIFSKVFFFCKVVRLREIGRRKVVEQWRLPIKQSPAGVLKILIGIRYSV